MQHFDPDVFPADPPMWLALAMLVGSALAVLVAVAVVG
jgi:hypothetical protein